MQGSDPSTRLQRNRLLFLPQPPKEPIECSVSKRPANDRDPAGTQGPGSVQAARPADTSPEDSRFMWPKTATLWSRGHSRFSRFVNDPSFRSVVWQFALPRSRCAKQYPAVMGWCLPVLPSSDRPQTQCGQAATFQRAAPRLSAAHRSHPKAKTCASA